MGRHRYLVDVVEVEPETLWETRFGGGKVISPEPLGWLRSCGRPLLAHGVGYPVGGMTAPSPEGVLASATSAHDLDAVHWSEHLAFNVAGDAHAGFLLPPVQTPEAVAAAVPAHSRYQAPSTVPSSSRRRRTTCSRARRPHRRRLRRCHRRDRRLRHPARPAQHLDQRAQRPSERRRLPLADPARPGLGGAPRRRLRDRRLLPRRPRRPHRPRAARARGVGGADPAPGPAVIYEAVPASLAEQGVAGRARS